MSNKSCVFCNNSILLLDKDYKVCYNCFYYYDVYDPNTLEDLLNGKITKGLEKKTNQCINCDSNNITLLDQQYICLSSNVYKFNDNIKVKYHKKLFYKRKYQLKKYIKNKKVMKTLIE